MGFINAEVAKLAVNGYITTKISYANMLAELCERLPGGDANAVTSALGLDRRIGRLCLRGGLAYGGPCLPRDNQALMAVAARCGARADLPAATHALNQHHGERLLQIVARHRAPGRDRIGILGLAYKADTPVIEASPGVLLANRLAEATETGAGTGSGSGAAAGALTATVTVFDPQALPGARPHLHPRVAIAESAAACVAAADIAIITAPWPEFAGIASSIVRRRGERPVVIDCWRMLDRERLRGLAEVVYLGEAWESACPVTQPVSS
jgi:UDPglucose 6-dehydrogenase